MTRFCCFGELFGGAELNVATALANWDVPVKYSTVLLQNSLADDIIGYITGKGIDPSGVVRFGQRIGTYYLPQDTDLKNAGVIYDRANSRQYNEPFFDSK